MSAAGRVGVDKFATGVIVGPGALTVRIEGMAASVLGDKIAPHGKSPHKLATVVQSSKTVIAEGRGMCPMGISLASCGHPQSTGSATVFIGP